MRERTGGRIEREQIAETKLRKGKFVARERERERASFDSEASLLMTIVCACLLLVRKQGIESVVAGKLRPCTTSFKHYVW